jgi:dolichol-phosphate mannosyltransferase
MLWIVIPAYNEEKDLPPLLPKINQTLLSEDIAHRIVVVDDGSIDDTPSILEEFKSTLHVDEIRHPINRGLGETERDGFEFVAMRADPEDLMIRVEADNTHEPDYIVDLIAKLNEGYDVVNTSRFQSGGGQIGVDGYRASISRAANLFMQFIFNIPGIRDYSCGYRAYRVQVIQDAIRVFGNNFVQLRGLGFTSTLETIVKLHLLGCRFAEVPFVLRYDKKGGPSKMVSSITTLGYFIMALLYHWPFGGWANQYRGLRKLYRENPHEAVKKYSPQSRHMRTASRISL